jgi:hypothetical protein
MLKEYIPRIRHLLRKLIAPIQFAKPVKPNPYLAVCSMFRDEAPYLKEWIEFHLSEGVEHFYLYDDNSSDDYLSVLKPFIDLGVVSLEMGGGRHQVQIYNDCLSRMRGRWVAFLDVDEFLFDTQEASLKTLLQTHESNAAVIVFWKLFGSGDLDESSTKGVVEDCVMGLPSPLTIEAKQSQIESWNKIRGEKLLTGNPFQCKSIINIDKVAVMDIHFPIKFDGDLVESSGRPVSVLEISGLSGQYLPSYDRLLIHHYWSRSKGNLRARLSKPGAAEAVRVNAAARPDIEQLLAWDSSISDDEDTRLVHRVRARTFPYVFVIGFNKTATRAISEFFTLNGVPSIHWDNNNLVNAMITNIESGRRIFSGYDNHFKVFSDLIKVTTEEIIEGNQFFREMEADYPGSLFILNNRDSDDWLQSRKAHGNGYLLETQLKILGTSDDKLATTLWKNQKTTHETNVRKYFANKDNFLEVDISNPNALEQISCFVGRPMNTSHWRVIGKTEYSKSSKRFDSRESAV